MPGDKRDKDPTGKDQADGPSGKSSGPDKPQAPEGDGLEFDAALKRVLDSAREEEDDSAPVGEFGETVFQEQIELDPKDAEQPPAAAPPGTETRVRKPFEAPEKQAAEVSDQAADKSEDDSEETRVLQPLPPEAGDDVHPSADNQPAPEQEPTKVLKPLPQDESSTPAADDGEEEPEQEETRVLKPLPDEPEDLGETEEANPEETVFQSVIELEPDPVVDPKPEPAVRKPAPKPRPAATPKQPKPAKPTVDPEPARAAPVASSTMVMTGLPPQAPEEAQSQTGSQETKTRAAASSSSKPVFGNSRLWLAGGGGLVVVMVVVGMMMAGVFESSGDSSGDGQPVSQEDQLIKLHRETTNRAGELSSRLMAVLTESKTTRDQLLEIEIQFDGADEAQAELLQEQRDKLIQASSMLIEKAKLIQDHVLRDGDFEELQALQSSVLEQTTPAERRVIVARLEAINARLKNADLQREQLEQALESRSQYQSVMARWRSYGFSWPLSDEDRTRIDEVAPDRDPLVDPGNRAGDLLAEGRFAEAQVLWSDGETSMQKLIEKVAGSTAMSETRVQTLLLSAELAMEENHLTSPKDDNAFAYYMDVLEIDPDSESARNGFGRIITAYGLLLESALASGKLGLAEDFLRQSRMVAGSVPGVDAAPVNAMNRRLETFKEQRREQRLNTARIDFQSADAANDYLRLASVLERVQRLAPDSELAGQVRAAMSRVQMLAGRTFADELRGLRASGPDMIVLPTGRFSMGESGRQFARILGAARNEAPAHEVVISQSFSLSKTEISVAQFKTFVDASGYQTDAERSGYATVLTGEGVQRVQGRNWRQDYLGRPADADSPVIHVSWDDAQAYASWLSAATRNSYRLPSESEFEFALRSGVSERFLWGGGDLTSGRGNLNGQDDSPPASWSRRPSARGDLRRYQDGYFGTSAVASFSPNSYGLYDMLGNVSEWTQDCYQDSHKDKDSRQGPREQAACTTRVVRGSDWAGDAASLRLSYRQGVNSATTSNRIGFRVARDFNSKP
jgi:formylglycine-generating enzyme required for sulfatase activity